MIHWLPKYARKDFIVAVRSEEKNTVLRIRLKIQLPQIRNCITGKGLWFTHLYTVNDKLGYWWITKRVVLFGLVGGLGLESLFIVGFGYERCPVWSGTKLRHFCTMQVTVQMQARIKLCLWGLHLLSIPDFCCHRFTILCCIIRLKGVSRFHWDYQSAPM